MIDPNQSPPGVSTTAERRAASPIPSARLHRLVLESIDEAIISLDSSRRITSLNAAAAKLVGARSERAVGQQCWKVLGIRTCMAGCPLAAVLAAGQSHCEYDAVIKGGFAQEIPVHVRGHVLRDEAGRAVGAVAVMRPGLPAEQADVGARDHPSAPPAELFSRRPSVRAIMSSEIQPADKQPASPEARRLVQVLQANAWRREKTASTLGISRSTLWRRMREYGLID